MLLNPARRIVHRSKVRGYGVSLVDRDDPLDEGPALIDGVKLPHLYQ